MTTNEIFAYFIGIATGTSVFSIVLSLVLIFTKEKTTKQ